MRYVAHFLHEAQLHGALIAQPAIIGSIWKLLEPHPRCRTRATDFVELMLPLLQLRVAIEVCMQVLSTGHVGMHMCSPRRPALPHRCSRRSTGPKRGLTGAST